MVRNLYGTCLVIYQGRIPEGKGPTKSQMNMVSRQCYEGKIKSAFKIGNRWFTNLEREGEMYAAEKSGA